MSRQSKSSVSQQLATRIGQNIKTIRVQKGLTQGELAEVLGMEPSTVSRIETGLQIPSIERLENISQVLHVPLVLLVTEQFIENAEYDGLICNMLKTLPVQHHKFIYDVVLSFAQHINEQKVEGK